jgi:hypothetical protein
MGELNKTLTALQKAVLGLDDNQTDRPATQCVHADSEDAHDAWPRVAGRPDAARRRAAPVASSRAPLAVQKPKKARRKLIRARLTPMELRRLRRIR